MIRSVQVIHWGIFSSNALCKLAWNAVWGWEDWRARGKEDGVWEGFWAFGLCGVGLEGWYVTAASSSSIRSRSILKRVLLVHLIAIHIGSITHPFLVRQLEFRSPEHLSSFSTSLYFYWWWLGERWERGKERANLFKLPILSFELVIFFIELSQQPSPHRGLPCTG